jgi:hypothetical protein
MLYLAGKYNFIIYFYTYDSSLFLYENTRLIKLRNCYETYCLNLTRELEYLLAIRDSLSRNFINNAFC